MVELDSAGSMLLRVRLESGLAGRQLIVDIGSIHVVSALVTVLVVRGLADSLFRAVV